MTPRGSPDIRVKATVYEAAVSVQQQDTQPLQYRVRDQPESGAVATPAVSSSMPIFQTEILNASDVCSNCFARQRRSRDRPLERATHADTDEDGYPIRDDDGHWVSRYSERVTWQTTVDDVPGPVVHEAGQLFCDCGADGAFTRIWDSRDVGVERRMELILSAIETLRAKGYRVDTRAFAETVVDELPRPKQLAPHRPDVVNTAFKTAAEAGCFEADSAAERATP